MKDGRLNFILLNAEDAPSALSQAMAANSAVAPNWQVAELSEFLGEGPMMVSRFLKPIHREHPTDPAQGAIDKARWKTAQNAKYRAERERLDAIARHRRDGKDRQRKGE
jgi:hypothetical protein